jgi:hypothetical protein
MNIRKNKTGKRAELLGWAIFLLPLMVHFIDLGYKRSLEARYKRQIAASFSETQGEVVAYEEGFYAEGDGRSSTIQYSYKVEGNRYSRKVDTALIFPGCKDVTWIACAQKRFWVIYSTEDPRKSLINFKVQIQDVKHPKFPETLDDFI